MLDHEIGSRLPLAQPFRAAVAYRVAQALAFGVALAAFGGGAADVAASPPPGAAARDTYFGTAVSDPYRYLEDATNPAVAAWMRSEAEATRATLDALPARTALLQRMAEIESAAPVRIFAVERLPGDRYAYLKRIPNDNGLRVFARHGVRGRERTLVDLDDWAPESDRSHAFAFYTQSPHGKYFAYGITESGAEAATMRVLRMRDRADVIAPIDRADLNSGESGDTGIGWLPDESGFFFNRLDAGVDERPRAERYQWSRVYLRRFGAPESERVPVFGGPDMQNVQLAASDMPVVFVPSVETLALALVVHGTQREFSLYQARLADVMRHRGRWVRMFGPEAKVTGFSLHRDEMYVLTHRDAPRFRILRTSLAKPDLAAAEHVYAPDRGIIQTIAAAHDALYIKVRDGMRVRLLRMPFGTGARAVDIALPGRGNFEMINPDSRIDGILVREEGWDHAYQYLRYDPRQRRWINENLQPRGTYDLPDDLEVVEALAKSHDGALVPLSIVHRKGLARDGNNPALLSGYGAYGGTDEPSFDPQQLAWLRRGGVNALCHARGGGVFGRAWYEAGKGATKANTWRDGIACAEYLVANGYSSPAKLAIFGGSAGGIFAGRAITERPDLFAAAVLQVGALDMVRSETTATGAQNIPEFGSVNDEAGFRALLAMSAYHHVRDGQRYPAVLLIHGVNDSRVEIWHSTKMAARLTAANPANVALLRLDYDAGHGSGSTRAQHQEELADMWSFILWRTGDPAFQPKGAAGN
jgi:prolyl oligopeptidase